MINIKLSIIIVDWNTATILVNCLKSIYKHLHKIKFEVIVVDNASTDNSVKAVQKLQKLHSNLILVKNSQNLGFSKANNIGAKQARGRFLFFLNSDTLLLDNSILKAVKYLDRQNSTIGILGPQLLNADKSIQASVFPPQTIKNAIKQFFFNRPDSFTKYSPLKSQVVNAVSGAGLLISQKDFVAIDGWNEAYFLYYEDLDLCRKIRQIKKRVYYYRPSKILHLHGQSGKKISQNQAWKRMIPSSIIYHGRLKHYLLFAIIWLSQKLKKIDSLYNRQ